MRLAGRLALPSAGLAFRAQCSGIDLPPRPSAVVVAAVGPAVLGSAVELEMVDFDRVEDSRPKMGVRRLGIGGHLDERHAGVARLVRATAR